MISNDQKTLHNLTKKTASEQKSLLKLFAKISLQEQKEIMKNQRSTFHKLKSLNIENYDSDIFTLASLLVAIADFTKTMNEMKLKIINFTDQKIHKDSKNQKLLTHWSIVKELKEKEYMSFRKISKFLKKAYKFEISHSLIHKVWIEIEEKEISDEY